MSTVYFNVEDNAKCKMKTITIYFDRNENVTKNVINIQQFKEWKWNNCPAKKTPIGRLMAALDDLMTKWLSHWNYWQSLIWSHVTIQYSFHLSFLSAVFFKDKLNQRVWLQITIMALYLSSREKAKVEFDKNVAKLILLLLSCLSASDKGGFWRYVVLRVHLLSRRYLGSSNYLCPRHLQPPKWGSGLSSKKETVTSGGI